jgi:hypothetical protein
VAVVSAAANVKDQLGRRQIFAIDQNQVEALRLSIWAAETPSSGRSQVTDISSKRQ